MAKTYIQLDEIEVGISSPKKKKIEVGIKLGTMISPLHLKQREELGNSLVLNDQDQKN